MKKRMSDAHLSCLAAIPKILGESHRNFTVFMMNGVKLSRVTAHEASSATSAETCYYRKIKTNKRMSLLACVHTTRVANSHVDSVTPFRSIILPCQQSPYLVNIQLRRLLHRGIHRESRGLQLTSATSLYNQCRSKGNISGGGARKCWRREPLGGSGGVSH